MSTRPILVGITGTGYPEQRNIIDLPFSAVRFIRHRDPVQLLDLLHFKATRRIHPQLHAIHHDWGVNRADVLHFFNKVSLSRTPWVSTFETRIPRMYTPKRKLIEALARPACKRLIAMSLRALRIQEILLADHADLRNEILGKTLVLHPAQRALIGTVADKGPIGDRIRLVMVGHEFFRKGGLPALRVLDRLIGAGAPFHLTIVSELLTGDHASRSGDAELAEARMLIARHPEAIHHHRALPNAQVMELLRASDAMLLPTLHDTYGYSVLEGQAMGCPVITTNVAALTEINNAEAGWLIQAPRNEHGDGMWRTAQDRERFQALIEEQLEAFLIEIMRNPEQLRLKGARALQRIRDEHEPAERARTLEGIYRQAMDA
jgi:glycosyltransferase involved in cell wall biosynthesis